MSGFAQSATAFDIDTCTIDSPSALWPVLYHRAANGSIDWVRSYELVAGMLALPWCVVSNSAGRTAALFVNAGTNDPISVDFGGTVVNGRSAVLAIDP